MPLPYLTPDFPGIGGVIKQRPEDFFVQEVPAYEPSGAGEHVYVEIQKVGISTFDAVDRIARALKVHPFNIGYAGMKDAGAVTRQMLSILGTTEQAVMQLKAPDLTVLRAARHGNKLRLGHLAGNRFAIKVREVNPTDVVKLQPVIDTLARRGMPNFFGEQRFGRRHDNHLLGAALIRGDNRAVLSLLLGTPDPAVDDAQQIGARKAFDRGDLEQAMKLMPRHSGMERRVLHRLMKSGKPGQAVRAVDERVRRLWISAVQSHLFNEVVARRVAALDKLLPGDLAQKHDSGACFLVEDAAAEQARADAFEISPTGPLLGYRMTLPKGEALAVEQAVFDEYQITPGEFRVEGRHKVKGARRPLRVQPKDVQIESGVDEHGPHITLAFTLPAGSFATVFLREIMKDEASGDDADMAADAEPGDEAGDVETPS